MKKARRSACVADCLVIVVMVAMSVILFLAPAISAAAQRGPDVISVMTYEIGSSNYSAYGFIGEFMLKQYGTKVRAVPAGNDTARMLGLRSGTAQFAGQGVDAHYAMDGITPRYTGRDWGPQDGLRMVWIAQHAGQAVAVRGSSNIHSIADLKGKKLPWIPGSIMNDNAVGHLAYADLTWDDVKKVNVPGYIPSCQAVIDGTVDAVVAMVTTSTMYELAGSPYKLRWLQEDSEEGKKKVRRAVEDLVPFTATVGANLSESQPLHCMTYAYPATICYETLDENVAYFMTKAIHEGYASMAKANDMMKHYWKLESFLELYQNYNFAILHPGTVRYLKEIGKWNSAFDKLQKDRTEHYKKLRSFWNTVLKEANEKKISDKEYPDFWLKKRASFLAK